MFGNEKKVHFTEVNDFLYKEFEELFFPLQEALSTKEAANFQLSKKVVTEILYEFLFFFIYTVHGTEKYKIDEYLDDLLKRFSSFFKPPLKLESDEYNKRFAKIDETMTIAFKNAKNSGGIGNAILYKILNDLPDSIFNEISITKDDELEKMWCKMGIEVDELEKIVKTGGNKKKNDALIYLPLLAGIAFGEMNIRFANIKNSFDPAKI